LKNWETVLKVKNGTLVAQAEIISLALELEITAKKRKKVCRTTQMGINYLST
jgi:hypothetical protein